MQARQDSLLCESVPISCVFGSYGRNSLLRHISKSSHPVVMGFSQELRKNFFKCPQVSFEGRKSKTLYFTKTVNSFQKLDITFSTKKSGYLWLFSYLDCRNLKKYLCHFVPKVVSKFLYEEIGELTVFVIFSVFGHRATRYADQKMYFILSFFYSFGEQHCEI